MDFATIIGLVMAVGAISGAYVLEGGHLSSIFLTAPLMIVIGGTLGATMVTTSVNTVGRVPTYLRLAATTERKKFEKIKENLYLKYLAELSKREVKQADESARISHQNKSRD